MLTLALADELLPIRVQRTIGRVEVLQPFLELLPPNRNLYTVDVLSVEIVPFLNIRFGWTFFFYLF